ncbi:hypothetical protein DFP72DRAFT_1074300 [Ephemerocybe angulata]|uniref:SUN domain-containing protein n=1 Tax=Ephemerocybe angulata TaxID=980116 RepID=A0A8H6HL27_9AGAR|nr:hypothetical protein DFP72DRAFT_1074300 [Tulosesus angulatus]
MLFIYILHSIFVGWRVLGGLCEHTSISNWTHLDLCPIVDSTLSSYDSSSFQRYSQRLDNLESQMDQRLNDIVSHVGLDSPKLDHDLSQRAFGARIVTGLTSPTSLQAVAPTSFFSSILPFGSGSEVKTKANVHLPSVVLERSLLLGDCWLFDGGAGHITIQLPYPANLTAITIDYLPLSQLGPTFHLYAPRSVTVWGLVRLSKHLTLSSLPVGQLHRPASHFSRHKRLPSRVIKPNDIFVPLVTLEYDIHSGGREIAYISDLEIGSSYDIVVVEVTENWGGDSTCLYHIGVHGQVESVIART